MKKEYTETISNVEYTVIYNYYPNSNVIMNKKYLLNNKLHNETAPAFIRYYLNGNIYSEHYYLNDEIHNKSGPAAIYYANGGNIQHKEYWINNKCLYTIDSDIELKEYLKFKNF